MTTNTVLIAEDEAMLRFVAVETLRDEGFEVFEAGDGADALAILRDHPEIRLLISDIKMPRLGGYELAEAALSLRPALKVVLMTGYTQDPSPAFVQKCGIPMLHKPFELARLTTLASEMLGAN
ncbi:MAG TPA: response regulator [Rhizomicrobium sp.]|jgi:CheY-like chemotaxis protein